MPASNIQKTPAKKHAAKPLSLPPPLDKEAPKLPLNPFTAATAAANALRIASAKSEQEDKPSKTPLSSANPFAAAAAAANALRMASKVPNKELSGPIHSNINNLTNINSKGHGHPRTTKNINTNTKINSNVNTNTTSLATTNTTTTKKSSQFKSQPQSLHHLANKTFKTPLNIQVTVTTGQKRKRLQDSHESTLPKKQVSLFCKDVSYGLIENRDDRTQRIPPG